jgi:hypothetical protein|tara:strand:- start:2888 stop:3559 length:672 start_codon:yes stop_codon:yes gene_type:complete
MVHNYAGFNGEDETVEASCLQQSVDAKEFSLFNRASLNNDITTVDIDITQSRGSGKYTMDNFHGCGCELKDARELQLSQPVINFEGGKGWIGEKGCLIDTDSQLRIGTDKLTDLRYINQLQERPHLTTGNYVYGHHAVDTESIIQTGNMTTDQRPCNGLSGITIGNIFTPMIPKLRQEVQNTKHIIPEDSQKDWVRSGLPTRQMARNADYMRRCQDKNEPNVG